VKILKKKSFIIF